MKSLKDNIKIREHLSFLKEWFKNTNDELEFIDSKNNKIKIENQNLSNFYLEFLNAFEKNRNHKIIGCDKVKDFVICLSNKEDLLKISQEIMTNPEKFYDLKNKDSYYDFLKYLWIDSPDFNKETRLTDLVDIK